MRNSYFAQAFRLATEDGSSDATVLPVVLEIDVKATDGSDEATPAQDPALEEGATADASAAEPAAENDDGSAPVDAPAVDAVPAAPIEGEGNESIEEFENNLITTDDLEAVETDHELEEQLHEEATVSEAVSEVEEVVKDQEELLNEHPENVNKEGVAIATECLYRAVKTAGLDPKMFQSLNQITVEYLASEDFTSPVQALKIVHEDSKSFVQSAKDGLKKLWEMIVNSLKKLWDFVKRIFGNHAAIAKKLRQQLKESNYNPEGKEIDLSKYFPASLELGFESPMLMKEDFQEKLLKAIIDANNNFVQRLNSGSQDLFGKNNPFDNKQLDMDSEINLQIAKMIKGSEIKYKGYLVLALGATKIVILSGKGAETINVTKDMVKEPKLFRLPTKTELDNSLYTVENKWSKSYIESLKIMVNNAEKVKPEKLNSKVAQYIFKQVCFELIKRYEMCLADFSKSKLRFAKHCMQAGSGSADKKEEETKK